MKVLAVVSILLLAVAAEAGYVTEKQYQSEFSRYVKTFNKKYLLDDFFNRYEIFKSNLDLIQLHNSQAGQTSTMGVNQFTDMTGEEFANKMTGYLGKPEKSGAKVLAAESVANAPASLDWRDKGAVTAVKDQGSCGSCWAFSATGSAEGAWYIAKNKLVSLSEQQLMDCSKAEGNMSCNGGLMDHAFDWIIKNKGICSEEDYPYTAKDSKTCNTNCSSVASVSSYANVAFDKKNPTDDTALMAAIQKGPVSVAIQASSSVFQMYTGGVITSDKCGTRLDHGVLLVGYGTDDKLGDYYVVKNSWGQKWGEQGYVRLARGMNQCGINQDATLPIV